MPDQNSLTHEWATIICEMEEVCYGEGIGGDSTPILAYIAEHYPDLRDRFPWFSNWPTKETTANGRQGRIPLPPLRHARTLLARERVLRAPPVPQLP
jgi:hypothetical protein